MPAAGQTIKPLVQIGRKADDCWSWLGPIANTGHGKKTYCGKEVGAHRWMWSQLFGPIPDGMVVYHTCDTKSCTNPHHLALGMQADANRQSIQNTLLPSDVAEIRKAKESATRVTAGILADRYGISPQTVRDIWRGSSWGRKRPNYGAGKKTA